MRLILGTSALSSITSVSSWRLRLVPFEVRMWRLYACPRLILPVPVFLKRLAAPLCVFIFGIVFFYYNINARTPPAAMLSPVRPPDEITVVAVVAAGVPEQKAFQASDFAALLLPWAAWPE